MIIPSAIGTTLISTSLSLMVTKAMDNIKNKAMDNIKDKGEAIGNIERDIAKIQSTLRTIQVVVKVAEQNLLRDLVDNCYEGIQDLLLDLVDIGYEARDVLDNFITFSNCVITSKEDQLVHFILSLMMSYFGGSSSDTSNIPLAILNRLAREIRSVSERFNEKIKENKTFIKLLPPLVGGGFVERIPQVGSYINKQRDDLFLGRREVKEGIMKKILHPNDECVYVDVIWGMGGIGKTTLAQSIYNDDRIKKLPKMWVCVGESKFYGEKVIKDIIGNVQNITGIGNLQTELVEKLKGDRFLIVLDDVWDVDDSEWNLLFDPLTNVGKGGLIIVTKRKIEREREVCAVRTIQTLHDLKPLTEEDSWSIFESLAYVDGKSDSAISDLKGIGKEIVKKLNGHPLALRVVGHSLLNKDSSTWTNFLESKLTKDDEVMPALRLSYNHLPQHLKACFTYCSLFPKGHEFDKNVLVEMWMAHDLIKLDTLKNKNDKKDQNEEQKRPDDVGAQYFEELVNASFLQCVDGKYTMHGLIHNLALLVSNGEFATIDDSLSIGQMGKVRHITITCDRYLEILSKCNIQKLLTLNTIFRNYSIVDDVFRKLKSIRVLVLCSEVIKVIPDSISELRHLRYLDVRETKVQSLPDSLSHLYNLQMIAAPTDAHLPINIVNICSLRYVRACLSTCKGVGKLTSLQELSSIRVCEDDNIRELGTMEKLRGFLTIEGLENVTSSKDAAGALMKNQTHIDELILEFDEHLAEPTISEEVLDALECPPNLTYLKISGYTGIKSPSWMIDCPKLALMYRFEKLQTLLLCDCPKLESLPPLKKFNKLQKLELQYCPKLESLPPLGELTSLKHLSLCRVGVKRLGDEFYGKFTNGKIFFPSLESLFFSFMEEFEEWDYFMMENSSGSFFPCLTSLTIIRCPKLVSVADFQRLYSLKKLHIEGYPKLQSLSPVFHKLSSLKKLRIYNCLQLKSLPQNFHMLSSLNSLKIKSCLELQSLPPDFHKLPSLNKLHIKSCPKLHSLLPDFHKLSSLVELSIDDCPKLQSSPSNFHELSSLMKLYIKSCPQLPSLLPHIHKFSSIVVLRII